MYKPDVIYLSRVSTENIDMHYTWLEISETFVESNNYRSNGLMHEKL